MFYDKYCPLKSGIVEWKNFLWYILISLSLIEERTELEKAHKESAQNEIW
jgi:hypothetical protein